MIGLSSTAAAAVLSARNALVDAHVDLLDAGSAAGRVEIYAGTRPADADTAITDQVLISTHTLADPAFPDTATGAGSANASPFAATAVNVAQAVATFARLLDSDDTVLYDLDVGMSGSVAEVILDTTTVDPSATVTISAITFSA